MSITMSQLASMFTRAADDLSPALQHKLDTFAQIGVGLVKSEIQNVHAVDTGTMLNSTTAERLDNRTYLVGPTVFYAVYVALGTSRMAARPFHITAARQLTEQINDVFSAGDLVP